MKENSKHTPFLVHVSPLPYPHAQISSLIRAGKGAKQIQPCPQEVPHTSELPKKQLGQLFAAEQQ